MTVVINENTWYEFNDLICFVVTKDVIYDENFPQRLQLFNAGVVLVQMFLNRTINKTKHLMTATF